MADCSRDTFNKLKHYVGVRLQQGVPIIDADWNEKEDIHKNELQLFLKWFIGNGIPKDNDGFHILPRAGVENDFLIKGGANGQPGICLVEGWDVRNETDIAYRAQPLFNNNNLAQKWGVATLPALTLPTSGQRTDLVYLDAWEREVNAQEDSNLVNPAIGLETCVRIKREWVVRVAEGTSVLPSPIPAGHVFYPLAAITRRAGQKVIASADITDKRQTDLLISSFSSLLIGSVSAFATSQAPEGWLECNGQAISRRDYPALFACIGVTFGAGDGANTFNVPDLRGEFIRGWDHGKNIDTGRTFGSLQADQMQSHKHPDSGHTHTSNAHAHSLSSHTHSDSGHYHQYYHYAFDTVNSKWGYDLSSYPGTSDRKFADGIAVGYAALSSATPDMSNATVAINNANANIDNPTASTQGTPRHGSETRARNLALMYCIKY